MSKVEQVTIRMTGQHAEMTEGGQAVSQARPTQARATEAGTNRTGANQTEANWTGDSQARTSQARTSQTWTSETANNQTGTNQTGAYLAEANQTETDQIEANRTGASQTGSSQAEASQAGGHSYGINPVAKQPIGAGASQSGQDRKTQSEGAKPSQATDQVGTVIFDLDGTLIDTSRDMIGAANLWFAAMGAPAPLDPTLDAATGLIGGKVMLRLGLRRLGRVLPQTGQPDEALIERGYSEFAEIYAQNICIHSAPYPGAVAAVKALRQAGYRTGICTNKPVALSEKLLKQLDLWDLFDSHIGAGSLPQRKPDPAPLLAAITAAGGTARRAVLIGDTDTDLNAARAAAVKIALVTFGPSGQAVDQMGADALLPGYEHLLELVKGLL